MSVPISNVPRRVVLVASGTGPYSFNFEILAPGDISVYRDDDLLTLTTDYTVTINSNGTGFVTLVANPVGATQIAIVGDRAIQRTTDFTTGGDLFATSLNDELDSVVIFSQQNAEAVDRALKAPQTDPLTIDMTLPRASDRAGNYLTFDVNGNPQAGVSVVEVAGVYAIRNEIVTVAGIDDEVVIVAGNNASVSTVAGSIANVNLTGGSIGSVNTVAGSIGNVNTVSGNISIINTVAGNITTVNAVGNNITAVTNVSSNQANINIVSGNISDVNTVAGSIANVNSVGINITNVNSVAGNATNINTTAANTANISTVAGSITNVNLVGNSITNVNTVAGIQANVSTVAGIASNVSTVAGISTNVTTVSNSIASVNTNAVNIANINQNAANIVAIQNASTNATNAAASATAAAASATSAASSAAAASAVVLGNEPVAPTIRPSLNLDFANTKQLDPRITFTRTTEARYYDGKTVAKAEENLVTFSQEFDNAAWVKTNSTVTANAQTAPDGTSTAETFSETVDNGNHRISASNVFSVVSGLAYTQSIFAKAGTVNVIQVVFNSTVFGSNAWANYDLSSGVLGSVGADATATITSVGNGWYRLSITATCTSSGSNQAMMLVSFADNNTAATRLPSYTGNTASNVYLWGAQLEQRSSVTAYTPTTTQPVTNYIPVLQTAAAGQARFDHNPVTGESLGLLIEEQRTNLFTYSAQFDDASWSKFNATITADTVVAPDGTLTGDKLVETTANNEHATFRSNSFTSGTAYTFTLYVKAAGRTLLRISAGSTATWPARAFYDVSSGTVTSTPNGTASITSVGNGWYRCVLTGTAAATSSTNIEITTVSTGTTISYTGDGYSGIYIWGAQLEAGAFPTSYIPTVASQVTRNADAASMTGTNFSSWYRADEGTLYSEFNRRFIDVSSSAQFVMISDGSASNRIFMQYSSTTTLGQFEIVTSGTTQASISSATITIGNYHKMSSTYKVNDIASSVNGATAGTDTSAIIPAVNQMSIGHRGYSALGFLNGTIKKIAYYPSRLANAQLQSLTTV